MLEAGTQSRIYAGVKPETTEADLRRALTNGTVADHLACLTPKPGDAVFLRAGTVHSLGGDLMVFEIQQNSDVTFRLYDWDHIDAKKGNPRELQVDKAMACIDFAEGPVGRVTPMVETTTPAECGRLFHCEHFVLWRGQPIFLQQVGHNIQRLLRGVGRARVLCHRAPDFSPHRQQSCASIHLVPRRALQRRPGPTLQFRAVAVCALCLIKFFARRRLFDRVPAADFRDRLLIHVTDILVTLETIESVGFDEILVYQRFHAAPRSAKHFERMATTTGNVIVRPRIAFELRSQLRSLLFPFFLRRNGLARLIPEVLCAAVRLKQQQLYVLRRRRMTGVVRDVTLPTACAHTCGIDEVRPLMIRR